MAIRQLYRNINNIRGLQYWVVPEPQTSIIPFETKALFYTYKVKINLDAHIFNCIQVQAGFIFIFIFPSILLP